jgi:hypothetical protein
MKKFGILLLVLLVSASAYWYFFYSKSPHVPSSPPTADELRRMEEVEKASSQRDPNAIPGAGVRPVGSLPKPAPVVENVGSSTATTTQESPSVE